MSGYLQYSNYGDDDEQPMKRKVAPTQNMQADKNQPKRILRTNQRTLRSKPSQHGQMQSQGQQGQGQGQQQPKQQHKYVQELIQKIHSYDNDEDVSDSEDENNNYVPMASGSGPSSPSVNPTTTIQQQFQTESTPNRNRFLGANPDDLSAKWNPAPAKESFSLQGAKALASQYLPSVFQASSVGDDSENKDAMMQKLDRIISLLEDQHDEKTGHVTEELVLYCFLGVFIIFIVDSFARAGKYVR
jgi:hypothetical protein